MILGFLWADWLARLASLNMIKYFFCYRFYRGIYVVWPLLFGVCV